MRMDVFKWIYVDAPLIIVDAVRHCSYHVVAGLRAKEKGHKPLCPAGRCLFGY
jgi:hypothetical protein